MAITLTGFLPLNWHYLSVCDPIQIGKTCFITGENASGKSTIIDAFRLLFFVSTKKFNAANALTSDRNKRDLASYVRGKIDMSDKTFDDNNQFLRMGQTITHIVAELYCEETGIYTVVGVCIETEALADSTSLNPRWWLCDNSRLDDFQFIVNLENGTRRFAKLDELRKTLRGAGMHVFNNQTEAKLRFSRLFGLTDNITGEISAFDAWVETQNNAIAFNPRSMKNVDEFIKALVIPEKEIRTDDFKEHLNEYHKLHDTWDSLCEQFSHLKTIVDECGLYEEKGREKRNIEILCDIADCEILENTLKELQEKCYLFEADLNSCDAAYSQLVSQKENYEETIKTLENDEKHQALKPLRNNIDRLEKQIAECKAKRELFLRLLDHVSKLASSISRITGSAVVDTAFIDRFYSGDENASSEDFHLLFGSMLESVKSVHELLSNQKADISEEKRKTEILIRDLREEISALEKGLGYAGRRAMAVKIAIQKRFKEKGFQVEPRFLCELLEFTDPEWAPAAEAFMAGYRFSIIVLPEHYREAARAYREFSSENPDIYNVTLVDTTAFVDETIAAPENTLASLLRSDNHYAKSYIDYSYSHVQLADDVTSPPDKDGTYISKDGMRYHRRGYSRMRPVKLSIGVQARENRKLQCMQELDEANQFYSNLRDHLIMIGECTVLLQDNQVAQLTANGRDILSQVLTLSRMIAEKDRLLREFESLQDKEFEIQLRRLRNNLEKCINQCRDYEQNILPDKRADLRAAEKEFDAKRNELIACEDRVLNWQKSCALEYNDALSDLKRRREKNKRKSIAGLRNDFREKSEAIHQKMLELNVDIKRNQKDYNSAFGTDFPVDGYASAEDYRNSYNKFESDNIPNIRAKLDQISHRLQVYFEESILSGLQDHIENAQRVLNKINKLMDKVSYNGRIFRFAPISAAPGMEEFFHMIRNRNNVPSYGGQVSFEGLAFTDEYGELRSQLFKNIEEADVNGKSKIDWLDYRSYCTFAINVHDASDENKKNKLSAIVGSGSGSEVQIPFYIILASALVQRYNNSNRIQTSVNNSRALRIMMIDECFDKMDYKNVSTMLDFIRNKLGIQLIASAPTDKFSTVGAQMDSIVFMKTDKPSHRRDCYCFSTPEFKEMIEDGEIEIVSEEETEDTFSLLNI